MARKNKLGENSEVILTRIFQWITTSVLHIFKNKAQKEFNDSFKKQNYNLKHNINNKNYIPKGSIKP